MGRQVSNMEVPWGEAVQIGGVGFATVFALLVILAVVIWLTGLVRGKISTGKSETDSQKKGD